MNLGEKVLPVPVPSRDKKFWKTKHWPCRYTLLPLSTRGEGPHVSGNEICQRPPGSADKSSFVNVQAFSVTCCLQDRPHLMETETSNQS